jgi:hypothetical protein
LAGFIAIPWGVFSAPPLTSVVVVVPLALPIPVIASIVLL